LKKNIILLQKKRKEEWSLKEKKNGVFASIRHQMKAIVKNHQLAHAIIGNCIVVGNYCFKTPPNSLNGIDSNI
jgi:hypothetical protein